MTFVFLLDTNVVSEFSKEAPEGRVIDWVAAQVPTDLYISAITVGELTRGVMRLPPGRRKDRLLTWLEGDVATLFDGRVLPFAEAAARRWGPLLAETENRGRSLPPVDLQIAATALVHGAVLVTRNVQDFEGLNVTLINPWILA